MTEPSAIWSFQLIVFDKSISLTQNVILSHARVALQAVIARIDQLYKLIATYPNMIEFYPHPDIPSILSDLCYQQGIASTILFNDSRRGDKESAAAYKLRLNRLEYVKEKCGSQTFPVLTSRKIRNSLTHIDEYLARELSRPKTGWMVDSAIGRRDQFTAAQHGISVAFCRTYISAEDKLLHFDNEISIKELRAEAQAILTSIWPTTEAEEPPQPQS